MLTESQLRDRKVATQWIAAGHSLTRLPLAKSRGMPLWIGELVADSGQLPPVGVVTDIGQLFAGKTLRETVDLPNVSPRLRTALRSYEDHVLGRMGASPIFETIRDTFCSLTPTMQSRAVTIVIQRLLSRIGFKGGAALSPGVVRDVIRSPEEETRLAGLQALSEAGEVVETITAAFEELAQKARRCAVLLDASDAFLVEHVSVLGELTQRLLIEQLSEVETALVAPLPKRLKSKRTPLRANLATALSAEEEYPAGGFSSISTSGTLENLVISELIYMDDSAPKSDGIDLFDLRYAEGELLYYTRDDAVFHRDMRVIQFLVEPGLDKTRIKDAGMPWQRIVMALGLLCCAVDRLCDWLGAEQGLTIRIAFLEGKHRGVLRSEKEVLELLLSDWVERGVVSIETAPTMSDVMPGLEEAASAAEVDVVRIGSGPTLDLDPSYQLAELNVNAPVPTLHWRHEVVAEEGLDTEPWEAWQRLTLALLSAMV